MVSAFVIWIVFLSINRKIESKFVLKIEELQGSIGLHTRQIQHRDEGLDRYNFLKYNLDEALRVQSEIQL